MNLSQIRKAIIESNLSEEELEDLSSLIDDLLSSIREEYSDEDYEEDEEDVD